LCEVQSITVLHVICTEEERQALHFSSEQQATEFLQKMDHAQTQKRSGGVGGDAEAEKRRRMKEMVDSIPTSR
jgi:transcriptional regulator of NAD metabolism